MILKPGFFHAYICRVKFPCINVFLKFITSFNSEPRNENAENTEIDDDTIDPTTSTTIDPKLGAKKRAKLEAKAEKKIKREVI